MPLRLVDRTPRVPPEALLEALVPPPRFVDVRFSTYRPDPAQPSQAQAVRVMTAFAERLEPRGRRRLRARVAAGPAGLYLDGGYGTGKTHLLASLWHAAPQPRAYCTFVELTQLVGAMGFAAAGEALSAYRLVAIDEFELDDPGDTVLVSTLLGRLVQAGVGIAATSNTLPGALGEGRFSASDFLREIQGLAAHFTPVRVDGEDYRHRGLPAAPPPLSEDALTALAEGAPDDRTSYDDFDGLLAHLAALHPSRYGPLVEGLGLVCLSGVHPVADQAAALRLVVLADRLYDRAVPVATSGVPLDQLFPADLLLGGYRNKYFRAVSRLTALARPAEPA